jgi:hypothetical protein
MPYYVPKPKETPLPVKEGNIATPKPFIIPNFVKGKFYRAVVPYFSKPYNVKN